MGLTYSLSSELTWGKGWGWGAVEEWGPDLFHLNKPEATDQWPPHPGSGEFWREGRKCSGGWPHLRPSVWTQDTDVDTDQSGQAPPVLLFCKTHLLHTKKQKMHLKKPTKLILNVLNAQLAHLIFFFHILTVKLTQNLKPLKMSSEQSAQKIYLCTKRCGPRKVPSDEFPDHLS